MSLLAAVAVTPPGFTGRKAEAFLKTRGPLAAPFFVPHGLLLRLSGGMCAGASLVYAPSAAVGGGRGGVLLVLRGSYGAAEGSCSNQACHLQDTHAHAHARDESTLSLHPTHDSSYTPLKAMKKKLLVC